MLSMHLDSRDLRAEHRYNEVVVDAAHFGAHLPSSVEALFYIGDNSSSHCYSENRWANTDTTKPENVGRRNHCEVYARAAHKAFRSASHRRGPED